jgi:hypothetical protein
MLNLENTLAFPIDKKFSISLRNFYEPENDFVWSMSKWCELTFDFQLGALKSKKMVDLIIDLDVFKAENGLPAQNALIYLNGRRVGSFLVERRRTLVVTVDPGILLASNNVLTIDTPDACRAKDHGVNDDRVLGAQLFSIQFRPAS